MRWLLVPLGFFLFSVLALSSAWASSASPPLDVFVAGMAPAPVQKLGGKVGLGVSYYNLEPGQLVADWYGLCLSPDKPPMTLTSRLEVARRWGNDPGYVPFRVDWEPKAMTLQPGQCIVGAGWYVIAVLQEGQMPSWGTGWSALIIWETSSGVATADAQ